MQHDDNEAIFGFNTEEAVPDGPAYGCIFLPINLSCRQAQLGLQDVVA